MRTDDRDLDALRLLAGPDLPPPPQVIDAARSELLALADSECGRPARGALRRRLRRPLALATALVALTGTAAATYLTFQPDDPAAGLLCARAVTRDPTGAVIARDGRPLTEQCAQLWREGAVGAERRAPAELTPCSSGNGAVYVFPAAAGVCRELNMEPAADQPTLIERRFVAFRDAVVPRVADECVSIERATTIVREELQRVRLTGWRIARATREGNGSRTSTCMSLAFDNAQRVVTLVPM